MSEQVAMAQLRIVELEEQVRELQAFKAEWEPVLITLVQSFVAFVDGPMGQMMPLPPQVKTLISVIKGEA